MLVSKRHSRRSRSLRAYMKASCTRSRAEAAPVITWRHTKSALKCAPKHVRARVAYRARHRIDAHSPTGFTQSTLRLTEPGVLHERGRSGAQFFLEGTSELTDAEECPLGQSFDRQVVAQVRMNPGREIPEPVDRRRLELQRLRELILPTVTLHVHHHLTGHRQRRGRAEVFLDQRQRQVDTRAHSRRRVELARF